MKNDYDSSWAEYRRIRKRGMYALVAFIALPFLVIPSIGLLANFIKSPISTVSVNLLFFVEVVLLFTAGYLAYIQYTWECPRCGERFGRLHDECQNCGLPRWANESDFQSDGDMNRSDGGGRSGPRI
jgi:ribosomal protein L37E